MIEGLPKGFGLMRAATLNFLLKLPIYNTFNDPHLKQLQSKTKGKIIKQVVFFNYCRRNVMF